MTWLCVDDSSIHPGGAFRHELWLWWRVSLFLQGLSATPAAFNTSLVSIGLALHGSAYNSSCFPFWLFPRAKPQKPLPNSCLSKPQKPPLWPLARTTWSSGGFYSSRVFDQFILICVIHLKTPIVFVTVTLDLAGAGKDSHSQICPLDTGN